MAGPQELLEEEEHHKDSKPALWETTYVCSGLSAFKMFLEVRWLVSLRVEPGKKPSLSIFLFGKLGLGLPGP